MEPRSSWGHCSTQRDGFAFRLNVFDPPAPPGLPALVFSALGKVGPSPVLRPWRGAVDADQHAGHLVKPAWQVSELKNGDGSRLRSVKLNLAAAIEIGGLGD